MYKYFRFINIWGAVLLVLALVMSGCGLFTEISEPTEAATEQEVSTPTPEAVQPMAPTEIKVPTEPGAPAATAAPEHPSRFTAQNAR